MGERVRRDAFNARDERISKKPPLGSTPSTPAERRRKPVKKQPPAKTKKPATR